MVGAADFPIFGDQSSVPGGRDDDVKDSVGSKISAAKFVDNTVHHAVYKRNNNTTGQYMTVDRPISTDFQVTNERAYNIIEEESSVILNHSSAAGVKSNIPPFFSDTRLITGVTPPIFLMSDGGRMIPDTVTTVSKGSRLDFRNLKGLTPSGVSSSFITGNSVHAGQIINVGMRTSDLVMKLFDGKNHSLNSISVGRPFAGPRTEEVTTYKGASLAKHSHRFLSKNFISTTIPDAARFISRHDNYHIFFDRYGNFIYAPDGFSNVDKQIDPLIASNVKKDSVIDVANSVSVKGKVVADNDNNRVTVNDVEMQKRDGVVKTMRVFDPAATTLTASRRSANQLLRLNRKAQGVIKSNGHQMAWELYPSDIIEYRSPIDGRVSRKAVLEVEHNLETMSSNFQLLSYESGIERVLIDHNSRLDDEEPTVPNDKVKILEMGSGGKAMFRVRGRMSTRNISSITSRVRSEPYTLTSAGNDIHSGFLIGHRNYDTGNGAGRAAIGTGLTPRLTGGTYNNGTITVSSTAGFPNAGYLVVERVDGDKHVRYTGKTSTTFTGVTVQAPSGTTVSSDGLSIRLLRSRGHEMRTVKNTMKVRMF